MSFIEMDTLKKIGPYQIIKRIAEGGMGEVYLGATAARFGVSKLVAIKTTLQNSNAEEIKEMFFNEIRVSANLNHQNIVKIHDFGEFDNNRGYMAMEYIHGITLRDLMSHLYENNERLSSSFILYIIHQVALGLAYAYHSVDPQTGLPLKLIHRDISPHNILISFEGEVKIIDFGIAMAIKDQDLEKTGKVKGKVVYMSPEQIQGKEIDSGSDIFSLGIVMWELLANDRFFAGMNFNEVRAAILAYDVGMLNKAKMDGRSDEVLGLLPIMLHHAPEKRANDANELARLLGTVLSSLHPDFSALALADYLKDNFNAKYKNTLEEIRSFVRLSEQTVTIAMTDAHAEAVVNLGELDEFETKIVEGSIRTGVLLEKIEDLTMPLPPETMAPQKDMWGSELKPKFTKGAVPVAPFYQYPKKPKPKARPASFVKTFAVVFVMLAGSLFAAKSYILSRKPAQTVSIVEPELTPAMIQQLRTSIQQPPQAPVVAISPQAKGNLKKSMPTQARKGAQKNRTIASVKNGSKKVPSAQMMKGKKLDMADFQTGLPYPSGTKCLKNCPVSIGAQVE